MKISVIGSGYVGLVTGVCLSENGNTVVCVDVDDNKVAKMQSGSLPIYEPLLDVLFERNLQADRLSFTTSLEEGVSHADIIFLALPTPDKGDGAADLTYVLNVAEQIGKCMAGYKIIVNKSTVPVGTAEKVRQAITKNTDVSFDVVSNPEFLREGVAVEDFMKPERIVIGSQSPKAIDAMKKLYQPFVRSGNPIIIMDEVSAELTKYAANAFLATKISFMNEVANFCSKVGANVDHVRKGIGTDSRIGKRFLFPGIGYGGSCFPKDVNALHKSGKERDFTFKILEAVIQVNAYQKGILLTEIKAQLKTLEGKKIAVWGLAFKPETDDIREAPALFLIDALLKEGAHIAAFDPEAMKNVHAIYGNKIHLAADMYEPLKDADALLICTEWSIFRAPDWSRVKHLLKNPIVFDGRNLYEPQEMAAEGFQYQSIGR